MRGVVFLGEKKIEVRELPEPVPGPGEVVIGIKASGLCGSDLKYYRAPIEEQGDQRRLNVRGHEPCGVIAEVGPDVPGLKVGDRVMMHHYTGCGRCRLCRIGYTQMCLVHHEIYGATQDGGHQEHLLVPASTCVPMPDGLGFAEGASCACGTGTAYDALKRLEVKGTETIAIFGEGPVGLSGTMLAATMGASVIAVDIVQERLELAKRVGADVVVDAGRQDPVEAVRELTGGEGADLTLEATGIPQVRLNAVDSVRAWGKVCFVGEGNTTTFDISAQIIHRQLTIYGSWTFSTVGLAEVAGFVVDRRVPLGDLITHRFPLERAAEAYELFEAGRTGKVVLEVG